MQGQCGLSGGTGSIGQVVDDADALQRDCRAWTAKHVQDNCPEIDAADVAAVKKARLESRDGPALFEEMRRRYPDLLKTYPLVFRFIVSLDRYDSDVFRRYLQGLQGVDWSKREKWLESQADYATNLYRAERPRAPAREVTDYHRRVLQSLREEDTDFKEAAEYAKEEVDNIKKAENERRRARLLKFALGERAAALNTTPETLSEVIGVVRAAKEAGEDPLKLGGAVFAGDELKCAVLRRYCNP